MRNKHIGVRVSSEEYEAIKKLAEDSGRTVSRYVKEMALNGKVIHVNREVFRAMDEATEKYLERNRLLKGIMFEIHNRCIYYPVDLEIIQKAVDENEKQKLEEYEEIHKILQALKEHRKE